jgi:methylated-DNA-[protein]-cysteine S-methyltransferase
MSYPTFEGTIIRIFLENEFIQYLDTPLGLLHIKATELHVKEASFVEAVTDDERPSMTSRACARELEEYFKGERQQFSVELQPQGTVFQQKVWELLQQISFGHTESYLTLSKRLGDPKSIRAAASANGKNPLAILIPCHRVIGHDGKLVGYAGGLWRKKWLLEHEARQGFGQQPLF